MKPRGLRVLLTLSVCLTASLSGCALTPVQPWEKGQLARSDMLMEGDALAKRFDEHIYASKEAAAGGNAVGGGGCGCN